MAIGIFLLFSTAVFLSYSNVRSQSLLDKNWTNKNGNSLNCAMIANFKEEIKKLLKDHLANVKNELTKTKNELKKDFAKLMSENRKEENSSISIQAAKNQCADALDFKGNNIYEYARSFGGPAPNGGRSRFLTPYGRRQYFGWNHGYASSGLSAISSCFWIKTDMNQDAPTMLSYAVPQRDNEFIVQLNPNITVLLKTKAGFSFFPYWSSVWVSDGKWHHVCVTWENVNGTLQIYKDAVLSDTYPRFKPGQPIAPNGIWIIGQEQDFFGGGFQTNNAFKGALTEVNVWNRVLDQGEISTLANECASSLKGNYKAYNDFMIYGGVKKFKPSCCN